jgi:hypothetical protein
MEAGDFDNTPAPSARPSLAVLRDSVDGRTAHLPEVLEIGRTSSVKHHLLKTSASGPLIVDRDVSAPPVLSRYSPPQPRQYDFTGPQSQSENRYAVVKEDNTPPKSPSPALLPNDRGVSPNIPASDRVCLDPALHGKETHAHAHHPGLLEGADFCDSGAPTKDIGPVVSSSGSRSPDNHDTPRYEGHSRVVKVRPAFNYHPVHDPAFSGAAREFPYGHSPSKVMPFDSRPQHVKGSDDDIASPSSRLLYANSDLINYHFPTRNLNVEFNVPAAKIRPFDHKFIPDFVTHDFGLHESKVGSFEGAGSQQQALDKSKLVEYVPIAQPHDADAHGQHGIHECDKYTDKTALDEHSPSDDSLVIVQTPSNRHAIAVDDMYPIDIQLTPHPVAECSLTSPEMDVEGHEMSQCPEFSVKSLPETHDMALCKKELLGSQTELHRISQCETCNVYAGPAQHTLNCFRYQSRHADDMVNAVSLFP